MKSEDDTVSTLDGPVWEALLQQVNAPLASVIGWGAATTQGLVRTRNEDSWGNHGERLFVVADGMGGFDGGDVAAEVAVRTLVSASAVGGDIDFERWIASVNIAIRAAALQNGFDRCGAAVVACAVHGGLVVVAHVGDARAYRLRDGALVALTRDHTVEAELRAEGLESLASTRSRRELGALTRYLGGADDVGQPVLDSQVPLAGDRLILCSDGISRQLSTAEMAELAMLEDPLGAAHQLVQAADEKGGRDNATALCIDFGVDPKNDKQGTRSKRGSN